MGNTKSEDLLTLIKNSMSGFSKSQKLIGDYIVNHYEKAAYMTAFKLGTTVGTSESTVVRFAIELGFDGYPDMQKNLQSYIKNKLTSIQRLEITNDRVDKDNILKDILTQDINRIRSTIEISDEKVFKTAVEKILSAEHLYIFGARSSNVLARFLDNYFQLIFDNVIFVQPLDTSSVYQQIFRMGEQDTLISISFPRYSQSAFDVTKYAHSKGTNIIAITDSHSSPLAPMADELLIAKSDMASFADSLVAPLSVINALIVAVGMYRHTEIQDIFMNLETLWDMNEVYNKE